MRLLDSDTLSHLWAGQALVAERLAACEDTEVGITSIVKCEMLRARAENLLKAAHVEDIVKAQVRFDRTEQSLAALSIVPFDDRSGEVLRRLESNKRLKKIGRADLLIASIALANEAVLITRNLRHFRQIPNLRLENWVD